MFYINDLKSLKINEFVILIKESIYNGVIDIGNAYKDIDTEFLIRYFRDIVPKIKIKNNLIISELDDINKEVLVDYFVNLEKIKAKKNGCLSLYDIVYNDHIFFNRILEDLYKSINFKYSTITYDNCIENLEYIDSIFLRRYLYKNEFCNINCKEISRFSITVSKAVYLFYNSKKVLDPCIGWGERLIGAMVSNIEEYHGYDPSIELFEKYKLMDYKIRKCINTNTRVMLNNSQFELSNPPENYFDLIFTSPPFYDQEIYNNEWSQANNLYKTKETFLKKFITILLIKSIKALTINGILLIYYPLDFKYIDDLLILNNMKRMDYIFSFEWKNRCNRFLTYQKKS